MKAPKKRTHVPIDWQRVLGEGTGFFGWQDQPRALPPQDWQVRHATWANLPGAFKDITAQGFAQTQEFDELFTACALHLAERSALRYRPLLPGEELTKGPNLVGLHVVGLQPAIEELTRFEAKVAQQWKHIKSRLSLHVTVDATDAVDTAVVSLQAAMASLRELANRHESRGRPSDPKTLLILSGLAQYIKEQLPKPPRKRQPPWYGLLAILVRSIFPPLPFAKTPNPLRSMIHQYRQHTHSTAQQDLAILHHQLACLRNKLPKKARLK